MHGREFDGVGLADLAGFEAKLLRLGRLEIGEKSTESRLLRVTSERRGRVSERIEVRPCGSWVGAGPRCDLDVESERPLDFHHELGERPGDVAAQKAQLGGERGHPRMACEGVASWAAEVVEGLDEAASIP